jgi:hypothetical protein
VRRYVAPLRRCDPEWDLVDLCREHGIVLLAFAALGHSLDPKVLDDPVITTIARRVHKTPGQVALAWAVQRGTAFLTTSTTPRHIQENFEISTLPEDAMQETREGITTNVRFNAVVWTGVPGFIPKAVELNSMALGPAAAAFEGSRGTSDAGVMLFAVAETDQMRHRRFHDERDRFG